MEQEWNGERRGISGSTLKIIAALTMLIDHFAAGVLGRYLTMAGAADVDINDQAAVSQWMEQNAALYEAYYAMRMIGRIAFPIYCFLLVEGFEHTRDRRKYACRLLGFAVISEIPFDLMFNGKVLEFQYQNVFFTLLMGLLVMEGLYLAEERGGMGRVPLPAVKIGVLAGGMAAAELARTDYGAAGVACITVLFLFRGKKKYQIMGGVLAFLWEKTAPLAFVPIWFYNGRRGWNGRYFFYLFYPLHLLLLYLACAALGVASYGAM